MRPVDDIVAIVLIDVEQSESSLSAFRDSRVKESIYFLLVLKFS